MLPTSRVPPTRAVSGRGGHAFDWMAPWTALGARLRLSHSTAMERASAHLKSAWQPGDLTFDAAQQCAYLYTSTGWKQLAITA